MSIAQLNNDLLLERITCQGRWAGQIYQRYGYWTSLGSAIATWAVIANLN